MRVITFMPQYEAKILAGTKTTTIRKERKDKFRHAVGDRVSLRVWTGRPYASKQREFAVARVTAVEDLTIDQLWFKVSHPEAGGMLVRGFEDRQDFAERDGFESWAALVGAFEQMHGVPFTGIRYSFEIESEAADG